MKTVAFVGFAPNTLDLVGASQADEIWTMAWGYQYPEIPRINRLFEMHPIERQASVDKREYAKPRAHYKWLKANTNIPVYMMNKDWEVPACIRYPIEKAMALTAHWKYSDDSAYSLRSSVDYMWALAVLEGFERVEIYGIELSSGTEYAYQRESYALWQGFALGRGIEVQQFKPSKLLYTPKRYGYDGFQMIYRQDLERLYNQYREKHETHEAKMQYLQGQFATAQKVVDTITEGLSVEEHNRIVQHYRDVTTRLERERTMTLKYSAAMETVEYLIRELDMEEVDEPVLSYPFREVEMAENGTDMG